MAKPIRERIAAGMSVLACLGLTACADLAESGPSAEAVVGQSSGLLAYRLVPITPAVVAAVAATEPDRLAGAFPRNRPPARIVLGVGDVVSIGIFEAAVGGLFVPADAGARPSNSITLPAQAIDNFGTISFPFGGRIRAKGLSTRQLQDAILARIKDKAIDPQVIVTVVSQETSLVSVEGEVKRPLRFPAPAAGAADRISDALTRAGGLLDPGWESWVSLERDGHRATAPFEALLSVPGEDVFVQPGDRILVYREPQKFVALGALGPRGRPAIDPEARPGILLEALRDQGTAEIPFGTWRLSLAQAVAKAGGLLDLRADPGSVFLYRREPAAVARRLGSEATAPQIVPVVYQLDLSDPAGFLLATRFPMRNGDVLYGANARAVEATKAVDYIGTYLATATNASSAALLGTAAVRGSGVTGLPTVGGLTVVPSGVVGLPGTIPVGGIGNGVLPTGTPATGGTGDNGGTAPTGTVPAIPAPTNADAMLAPRSTMTSPASR